MNWIDIKHQKPHHSRPLLVTNGEIYVTAKYVDADFIVDYLDEPTEISDVTHWMEFPYLE